MKFNIIDLTDEQLENLTEEQMLILRLAQNRKNSLIHKADQKVAEYGNKLLGRGMENSTLLFDKRQQLDEEADYECAIMEDNLQYDLALKKPENEKPPETGYLVDYTLSYSQRYKIVRDYYLAIQPVSERMKQFEEDKVVKKYLGSYYKSMYNMLATHD